MIDCRRWRPNWFDRQVAVIVAATARSALAQGGDQDNSDRLSIGGDPVADGLVASLSRPGGNVTGVANSEHRAGAEAAGAAARLLPTATRSRCWSTRTIRTYRDQLNETRRRRPAPRSPAPRCQSQHRTRLRNGLRTLLDCKLARSLIVTDDLY